MANVLSLALKVTADASGLKLDPVQRALQRLGDEADLLTSQFDRFAQQSDAASQAQARIAQQSQDLTNALRDGQIGATQFATEFERLSRAADQEAAAFERAAQITRSTQTDLERYNEKKKELKAQLDAGRISLDTYNRALANAASGLSNADRAAAGLPPKLSAIADASQRSNVSFGNFGSVLSSLPGPLGSIAGQASGLSSTITSLAGSFGGAGGGIAAFGGSVAALAGPIGIAVAAIAAFAAAAKAVVQGLQELSAKAEQLSNTANRLGTSFEFVQVLDEAARRSGLSMDSIATAVQKFQVNVDKARNGSDDLTAAFGRLGISQQDLQTSDPTELAVRVAEALEGIEDPAERAALATQLLGKQGLELLPAFKTLDDARQKLDRFSASLSQIDLERLNGVDDAFDNLQTALKGLGQNLLLPFSGLVEGITNAIADTIAGFTKLIEPLGDRLAPILDAIGESFAILGKAIFNNLSQAAEGLAIFLDFVDRVGAIVGTALRRATDFFIEFTGAADSTNQAGSRIVETFQFVAEKVLALAKTMGSLVDDTLTFLETTLGVERATRKAADAADEQSDAVRGAGDAAEEAGRKAEEAAKRQADAQQRIIDRLLEQQRIDEQFGGDNKRAQAAEAVAAIEAEIAKTKQEFYRAQAAGDTAAQKAAQDRLFQLGRVLTQQQDIASGAAANREAAAQRQKEIDDAQRKRDEDRNKAIEDADKKIAEAREKYIEAAFELERNRINELNRIRGGALEIGDLRTAAGSNLFLDLAGGRQDSAIDEYRKQRAELEKLNRNVQQLQIKRAEILGGVG